MCVPRINLLRAIWNQHMKCLIHYNTLKLLYHGKGLQIMVRSVVRLKHFPQFVQQRKNCSDSYEAAPAFRMGKIYLPDEEIIWLMLGWIMFISQEGRTPLHYAAALHDSGIFYRYLLKCGADEHIQDKVGMILFWHSYFTFYWNFIYIRPIF